MKKRIEGYLSLEGRGQYRFALFDMGERRYSGVLVSSRDYDKIWDRNMRGRPTLHELTDPEKSAFLIGWKDAIFERYNRNRDLVLENPNTGVTVRVGGGVLELAYIPDYVESQPKVVMTQSSEKIPTNFAVLSFHIQGYKTEREGQKIQIIGPDDVTRHFGPQTVSQTIEDILRQHDLCGADIISISGDMTGQRDIGSWDFWMFCRNPNSTIDALRRSQREQNAS